MHIPEEMTSARCTEPNFMLTDSDSTIRPFSIESHPVVLGNSDCPTVMMDDLTARVGQWVAAGVQRALVIARPGFGKTHAMNFISRRGATQDPEVGFARINIAATKTSAFSLGTIKLYSADREPSKPIAINDSGTLQKYLHELVNRTGQRSIVLWLDDAHLLNATTDDSLRMLQSRLEKVEIRLSIILVGLPVVRKLNERVSLSDGTATVIPAPPANEFELHGLRTALDVEYSLGAFDNTFYPSGSSWSFTRFFLPLAHLNGFRLKEQADVLWRVFSEETRDRARTVTEVPILYFLRSVESALIDGASRDCADLKMDQEFWKQAVLRSGWVESQEREWVLRELHGVEELG